MFLVVISWRFKVDPIVKTILVPMLVKEPLKKGSS